MAIAERDLKPFFIDKAEIRRIISEQNKLTGFVPVPNATAEKAQAMSLALGIRPEDNILSSGIIAARYEE